MKHKEITVNQEEKKHIRPYFKLKGERYGISDKEMDSLLKYDDNTKKISIDGMDVDYPYENVDSKAYFNKSDLDSVWNEYVKESGKTLTDKQRYSENSDYISEEYKRLNEDLKKDPFSTEYALSIYKRYTDAGNKSARDSVAESRVYNQGSVDTTAIADAKKLQMDFKDKAYEKIADYALEKSGAGLKILESFSDENQKIFDNMQTEKTNDIKIAKEKSEITGEIPVEIAEDNPYIDPITHNVYDVDTDYQEKINSLKDELKNTTDGDEKTRLIKKYNNLIDARYAKIVNNDEFKKYINEGDIVSEYKSFDNQKDIRDKQSDIKKSEIQSETDKYSADKKLEGEKYSADKSFDSDIYKSNQSLISEKYKADKDYDSKKYAADTDLKEKALDGIMQHEKLEYEKEKAQEEQREKDRENAEEYGYYFGMPVNTTSYTVSSGYGPRDTGIKGASTYHKAVDIACGHGESVVSSKDGVVSFAGWVDGYGNTVEIRHDNNVVTKYHHMAETPKVKVGDKVKKGQEIGKVGSTGISSGNHLDFQIFIDGEAVNPADYLPLK